jgi:hypothetical protein
MKINSKFFFVKMEFCKIDPWSIESTPYRWGRASRSCRTWSARTRRTPRSDLRRFLHSPELFSAPGNRGQTLTLSRPDPDLIPTLTLSRPNFNLIPTQSRPNPDPIPPRVWPKSDPIPTRSRPDPMKNQARPTSTRKSSPSGGPTTEPPQLRKPPLLPVIEKPFKISTVDTNTLSHTFWTWPTCRAHRIRNCYRTSANLLVLVPRFLLSSTCLLSSSMDYFSCAACLCLNETNSARRCFSSSVLVTDPWDVVVLQS